MAYQVLAHKEDLSSILVGPYLLEVEGDTDTNNAAKEATGSQSVDKVTEKFNWTVETTSLLISLRQDHQAMFDSANLTKKGVANYCKEIFKKCKSSIYWSQLTGKWVKIERKLKDVKGVNGKSGSGRREFLYEREKEEAIGGNPNITPMATYSSMNDECVGENSVCENSNSLSEKTNVSKGVKRKRENMCDRNERGKEEPA